MKVAARISKVGLGEAICRFRESLDLTQEEMAHVLGCRLRALQRWEGGESVLGGEWLIGFLRLCRDSASRDNFVLDIIESSSKIPSTPRPELPKEEVKGVLYPGGIRRNYILDKPMIS